METVTITTQITTCRKCPFFKEGNFSSTDGFDRGADWICQHEKTKGKIIAGFVEWHEENKTPIPKWCPIRTK